MTRARVYRIRRTGVRRLEPAEMAQMNSWSANVETIARNLYERGLSGQNVLISLPRGFEFIWAFLGCLRAGAVAVPLDFPGAEIAFDPTSAVSI